MINRRKMILSAAGGFSACWLGARDRLFGSPPPQRTRLGVCIHSYMIRPSAQQPGGKGGGFADPLNFLEHCQRLGAADATRRSIPPSSSAERPSGAADRSSWPSRSPPENASAWQSKTTRTSASPKGSIFSSGSAANTSACASTPATASPCWKTRWKSSGPTLPGPMPFI